LENIETVFTAVLNANQMLINCCVCWHCRSVQTSGLCSVCYKGQYCNLSV